ncbi:EAL domain-containing protein [Planococcus sp. N028]|uniref:EAL domain-containing protein n=1 Tax=Planococcus shixiaomingii TaxID=3058393 RepID=A0ABT8MYZ0_9BACL|nr:MULTISPECIES: EAL domain-containing protein [unclassified Planococcus (in: firmicutes)]MDN7240828.1 EAL domain-containing protein [Planococcus sp. N028]WKA53073.1 EAL domain-containing protein [Planococcus sp. N022]
MLEEQTRYSRLAHITKLINSKLELREVLEQVTLAISEEIVQCDSVGIYLPEPDGQFKGYVGKPEVINGMTLDMHVIDTDYDLLAKEVIEKKQTIYIPDTAKDNRPDPRAVEGFRIKSLLVLPITYEDEMFGLVYLFDYGITMNLTEDEIQTVEAYVNMAGVAVRNATNLTRKENLIAEKQLLLDLTRDLSMCSTMQEALDKCFYYVGKVLNNFNTAVHLLDPLAGKKIKPANLSRDSDWTEEEWIKTHGDNHIDQTNDRVLEEVCQTKRPLLIPDVFADSRPNHDVCRKFGIKGMLMLPLVATGEVLGALAIPELEKSVMFFSEADIQLAQSIADATASTLSNFLYMEKQEVIIEERTSEIRIKNRELERVVSELETLSRERELILNSAGEGIFGLDLEGNITFCNPASESMLGYEKGELIGKPSRIIFNWQMNSAALSVYPEVSQKFFKKDGSSFSVEYVISLIKEGKTILGEVVTFRDITERKHLEEEIKHLAYYDSLTELPNRVLLNDKINQELTDLQGSNLKLALLYLDLDRFKLVNDSLGHSYGDVLLREVAQRLSSSVPKSAIVSRQGGDEFTIVLPRIQSEQEVLTVVESVIDSFAKPFSLKDNEVYVKTSIGISVYPEDGKTAEDLIKNADAAMYKSKEKSGTHYHFFETEMSDRNMESILLENALYKALDNEELEIYYQPQIDSRSNTMIGVEALLRWNHPTEGMVSPVHFIPIAEETGLIIPIGRWVLINACKQLIEWHKLGHSSLCMSVNLSGRQFEEDNLVSMIEGILQELKLAPEFLHIELTENQIVKNTKVTMRKMKQLKELGVKIAIDDFGTGYSSLGYLKNFPIDALKIDKSFIQDVVEDNDNAAITNTIITLAQNLKLNVIAEGVETEEQLEFLLSRNCTIMQGFFFSRPIKAEELTKKYLLKF